MVASACCSLNSFGQQADVQLTIGFGINFNRNAFEYTAAVQVKKHYKVSKLAFSLNYNYDNIRGHAKVYVNGKLVSSDLVITTFNVISALTEYRILKSKRGDYRGLSFGLGPAYNSSQTNNRDNFKGLGFQGMLGYQGGFNNKWFWGVDYRATYVFIEESGSIEGRLLMLPITFKIGFIPGLKRIKKE